MKESTSKSPLKLHNGVKHLVDLGLAFRKVRMLRSAVNTIIGVTREPVLGFFPVNMQLQIDFVVV